MLQFQDFSIQAFGNAASFVSTIVFLFYSFALVYFVFYLVFRFVFSFLLLLLVLILAFQALVFCC